MFEGIPKRAKVHFVSGLHFALGLFAFVLSPPVNVVVSGDWEPRAGKFVHDGFVFLHLRHPDFLVAVTIDKVANGHDEIRLEEIGVANGVSENRYSFGRSAGSVAINDEGEGVLFIWKTELVAAFARGHEASRGGGDRFVFLAVTMMMVVVADVWIYGRVGEGGADAKEQGKEISSHLNQILHKIEQSSRSFLMRIHEVEIEND